MKGLISRRRIMKEDIFILAAKRTPIGKFNGALSSLSSEELLSSLIPELCQSAKVSSDHIQSLFLGNVLQAGQGQNVARLSARKSLNQSCTGHTINMVCGSGLKAITSATQALRCHDASLVIAGGSESMSNAPYLVPKARQGLTMGHHSLVDSMIHDGLWDVVLNYHMGITAENIAERYDISREEQDQFALQSQQKAGRAIQDHAFHNEIVPISIPQRKKSDLLIDNDEFPRPDTRIETLESLRPVFKKEGSVTAGNASGINDGAAALVLATESYTNIHKLNPMARIVSYAEVGVDPSEMGMGPAKAIPLALKKAGWTPEDVDLYELNEAFAAQSLGVLNELDLNPEKVNVNGGAIALGHPIGASGARVVVTLIHELKRRQLQRGCVSLCIGGGMGIAACFELI